MTPTTAEGLLYEVGRLPAARALVLPGLEGWMHLTYGPKKRGLPMKGKGVILSVVLSAAAAMPAVAAYEKIQHNMVDATPDSSFDPVTGKFEVLQTTAAGLTLSDPTAGTPAGVASNVKTQFYTFFDQVISANEVQFTNGFYSITFDFDPAGPDPLASYELSGPMAVARFTIGSLGSFPTLDGIANWTATTVILPGSDIWPDGGGYSGLDSLTIAFDGTDFSSYDWEGEIPIDGNVQTTYSVFPEGAGIPEPTSLALIAIGALALVRRRN
jgi:hypothetical protein